MQQGNCIGRVNQSSVQRNHKLILRNGRGIDRSISNILDYCLNNLLGSARTVICFGGTEAFRLSVFFSASLLV